MSAQNTGRFVARGDSKQIAECQNAGSGCSFSQQLQVEMGQVLCVYFEDRDLQSRIEPDFRSLRDSGALTHNTMSAPWS